MSFQSAIPRQVALQQCLPLLHRLGTILNNQCCRTMILQRAATTPLTPCLSPRVHSSSAPSSHMLTYQILVVDNDERLNGRSSDVQLKNLKRFRMAGYGKTQRCCKISKRCTGK